MLVVNRHMVACVYVNVTRLYTHVIDEDNIGETEWPRLNPFVNP